MLEKKNPEYKNKYYVDIFNELIKEKEKIKILNIFDYWTEIDTLKDLNHLRKILMKPDLFKVDLSYPVVFVSGQIRTGKVILVKLLSTLPKFEKPLMSAIFEQIFTLKHINQISNTVSNYLITKFLNSLHYNQAIGRDLNLRTNEITSLKEYQKPERYLAKAKQKNAYSTFRKSLKENFTIPFLIHNGILEAQLLLSAKKNSKLIEIFKNPFDLVISWKKKISRSIL